MLRTARPPTPITRRCFASGAGIGLKPATRGRHGTIKTGGWFTRDWRFSERVIRGSLYRRAPCRRPTGAPPLRYPSINQLVEINQQRAIEDAHKTGEIEALQRTVDQFTPATVDTRKVTKQKPAGEQPAA